jgi:DNA processing protein
MNHTTLHAWLRIHLAKAFSPLQRQRCLELFSSPVTLCQQSPKDLRAIGLSTACVESLLNPDEARIDAILTWQSAAERRYLISYGDERYPAALREISDPPLLLYVEGDLNCLNKSQLAMVGSRDPSASGRRLAKQFATELSQAGLVITSGLALGIDGICHQAALDMNQATIAVLGASIDHVYPKQHARLATEICQRGALVSEFALGTPPRPLQFPRRNRIISGLSLGTLVVEATRQSGSLITARLANEQGRDVFAIPSSIHNHKASGCHWLIQQGAKLVTGLGDILNELNWDSIIQPSVSSQEVSPAQPLAMGEEKLLECIGFDVIKFEQLVEEAALPPAELATLLCQLLLKGYINEAPGGYSRVIA